MNIRLNPNIRTKFGFFYKNWNLEKLPDYVFFQEGPGIRTSQFTDHGMKVINVKNILADGTIDVSNSYRYISLEEFNSKYKHFEIKKGDIVVSSSGWSYGKVGRIKKNHLPLMMNTSVIRFSPLSTEVLNIEYLYNFLRSSFFKNQIENFIIGCQQPNFGPSHLKRMLIPIPPLSTQQKIASILSTYDDLIENNTKRIKILEEMAQTIYKEWFVKFRFPGHEQVKRVESELGLIPEGWEVKKLEEIVAEIIDYRGKTPKKLGSNWSDAGVLAISAKNIKQGRLINLEKSKFVDEQLYKKWMKSELQQGDILMTSEAPLGELYYLIKFKKFCLSQRVYGIRANLEIIKPDILYCSLSSNVIQEQIYARRSGTTVSGIRQTELRKVLIIVPPMKIQISASKILNDLFLLVENLQQKNINLRETRNLLLPKLISGQIDVENLDIETGEIVG